MTGPADLWAVLPLPLMLLRADGTISQANPAAQVLLGRSMRQLRGAALAPLLGDPPELAAAMTHLATEASPLSLTELEIDWPGAPRAAALVHFEPVPEGWLLMVQIAKAVPLFASGKGAQVAIGMSQMLVHEIKNPLAGITGAAQLLEMSADDEGRALTGLIVEESQRIVALLEQVERFGDLRPALRTPHNLHDALRRARHSAVLGQGAGLTFIEDFDPSLPLALVDVDQLQQVLLNLITNAAQAGATTLRLRSFYDPALRQRQGADEIRLPLHIELADDGPGIPADLLDNVFEPFVTGRENGTGLGLALVSKLMRDNGGLVGLSTGPNGTQFRLSFPRAPEES